MAIHGPMFNWSNWAFLLVLRDPAAAGDFKRSFCQTGALGVSLETQIALDKKNINTKQQNQTTYFFQMQECLVDAQMKGLNLYSRGPGPVLRSQG